MVLAQFHNKCFLCLFSSRSKQSQIYPGLLPPNFNKPYCILKFCVLKKTPFQKLMTHFCLELFHRISMFLFVLSYFFSWFLCGFTVLIGIICLSNNFCESYVWEIFDYLLFWNEISKSQTWVSSTALFSLRWGICLTSCWQFHSLKLLTSQEWSKISGKIKSLNRAFFFFLFKYACMTICLSYLLYS